MKRFLFLLLITGVCGWAQVSPGLQCLINTTVTPTVRNEGLTELTGDIVLNCNGGNPTALSQPVPQANITVYLNTQVTSRLLQGDRSEALLLIDEPQPGKQLLATPGATVTGTGTGQETFDGSSGHPNVYQGIVSGNSVTFIGVPIDPPSSTGSRIYRITNVRANANQLGISSTLVPSQVLAFISTSGPSRFQISNAQFPVATVRPGLSAAVLNALSKLDNDWNSPNPTAMATLRYTALFGGALKPRLSGGNQNIPGAIYNSESNFILNVLPQAGLADFGTRLRATFNNVPSGTDLYVSTNNVGSTAERLAALTIAETGNFSAVPSTLTLPDGTKLAKLSVTNGAAAAVWEILNSDPLATQNFDFSVWYGHTPCSTVRDCPAVGTGSVNLSFAPTPTGLGGKVQIQPVSDPIPRFAPAIDTGLPRPFVSSGPNFDTGTPIANTGAHNFAFATITSSIGSVKTFEPLTPFNGSPTPTVVFPYAQNGIVPYPVNIPIQSSQGQITNITLGATLDSGGAPKVASRSLDLPDLENHLTAGWLTVTASGASTPLTLTVSVNPAGSRRATTTDTSRSAPAASSTPRSTFRSGWRSPRRGRSSFPSGWSTLLPISQRWSRREKRSWSSARDSDPQPRPVSSSLRKAPPRRTSDRLVCCSTTWPRR